MPAPAHVDPDRAGRWAGQQVGECARPVTDLATERDVNWHTINDAVIVWAKRSLKPTWILSEPARRSDWTRHSLCAKAPTATKCGLTVTNLTAGIADHPPSHEEVTEADRDTQHRFAAIIDHLLHDLANIAD